ncbi:MAG: tetratricopeptide repeat protein [Bacteroidaceae bacterium]
MEQLLAHPERLDGNTLSALQRLLDRYPYFQTARLLYLRNLYELQDERYEDELTQNALWLNNRKMLFDQTVRNRYEQEQTPERIPAKLENESSSERTMSLIDAFLATCPAENMSTELEVADDYPVYMLEGNSEKTGDARMKGQELIDSFIASAEASECASVERREVKETEPVEEVPHGEEKQETAETVPQNGEEEDCFTETLAKIYVKQQRYEKALEIIKKLSLNYPKKNAYFADQIRFLEKLIINNKSK